VTTTVGRSTPMTKTGRQSKRGELLVTADVHEVAPGLVEVEVMVPRLAHRPLSEPGAR
jgi:hypothetical protein